MAMNLIVGLQDMFPVGANSDYPCIYLGEISFARFLPISPMQISLPGGGLGLGLT